MMNPGGYLSRSNRYAALLDPSVNNGSHAGGVANVLQRALLGFLMNQDQGDETAATQAMTRGASAKPWVNPDTGETAPGQTAGGHEGAITALSGLADNPFAGRLASQLMGSKIAADSRPEGLVQVMGPDGQPVYARQSEAVGQPAYVKPGPESADPSSVREWQFFNSLPEEDQRQYLLMKRANPYLNLGDVFAQPDPMRPGTAMGTMGVGVAPKTEIQDDRIVTAPAVPGGGRSGGPAQPGSRPTGGATPYVPMQMPGGAAVTDLPPSPKEAREIAEGEEAKAGKRAMTERYADVVLQDIDRALGIVDNATIPVTGAGSYLSVVPSSSARDLAGLLDTVRANIGFDRLQQMRDASPTGGALGQVSEFENRLLQSTLGNLEQSQSEEQFRQNLERMRETYLDIIHGPGNRPAAPKSAGGDGGWSIQKVE